MNDSVTSKSVLGYCRHAFPMGEDLQLTGLCQNSVGCESEVL